MLDVYMLKKYVNEWVSSWYISATADLYPKMYLFRMTLVIWSFKIYVNTNCSVYCLKVLLEWIQFWYDKVTLFVQNNIQKNRTQNMQWKQRYRWKLYRSVARRNLRHFPPASGQMTPTSVCLWRHREHGDDNKRRRQRRFEPSQEMSVKKMVNGNLSSEFISLLYASVYGAAISIQNCVSPLVLRLHKVQER